MGLQHMARAPASTCTFQNGVNLMQHFGSCSAKYPDAIYHPERYIVSMTLCEMRRLNEPAENNGTHVSNSTYVRPVYEWLNFL